MKKLVKNSGGALIRVIQAINGFKIKYGIWPSNIYINAESLEAIKSHHLTPDGFRRLNGFININSTREIVVIAKGPSRRSFDYGLEEFDHKKIEIGIAELLGFDD